ncbi:MAG: Hsp20/alpha crystallin family protein [Cyanobacteria bacterium]|jgi:HSP20 family protein|nr:Hsp20/alpha crystallin family protein [Cyanobacteriota bacterium]
MLTLRHSPFDLFDRLEQQLQTAERVPAAEVIDTPQAYEITLELPGVDKDSIDVKATDRSLIISAERRGRQQAAGSESESAGPSAGRGTLLSEIRYGTWSRSFRFPGGIQREGLEAQYRDGLLCVKAPKAQTMTSVSVKVEG